MNSFVIKLITLGAPIGNAYAIGNNGGRPPKYKDAAELEAAVNQYFINCKDPRMKATITGLTLFLGFESRSSLDDYANRNPEFSYIIKRSKLAVENSYELSGQVIDIFALKNMGWQDKTQTELTGKDGKPIQHESKSSIDASQLSDEVLEAIMNARKKDE